jgi:hypothetical protein
MFIPCLHDPRPVSHDDLAYSIQLFSRETLVSCQRNRLNPEFADHPFPLNMYVIPLITIKAVKEKPVRPGNIADRRHIHLRNEL